MWVKLLKNKKTWYIIGGLVLAIAVYIIYKRMTTKPDKTFVENPITYDPEAVTLNENDANIIVRTLLQAMNQRGTDEQSVVNALTGLNRQDLLMIIAKFGVKPYFDSGLDTRSAFEKNVFGWINVLSTDADLDLIGWLKEELSGTALNEVTKIFAAAEIPF